MSNDQHRGLRSAAVPGVIVLLLFSGTGCSAEGEERPGDVDPPVDGMAALPLESYLVSSEDQEQLSRAQDILTDTCMRRYGFVFPPAGKVAPTQETGDMGDRRYGLDDAEHAARYGYAWGDHRDNQPEQESPEDASSDLAELSETALLVYGGEDNLNPNDLPDSQEEAERHDPATQEIAGTPIPVGGCQRESYLKLYAPSDEHVDVLFSQNLAFEANGRARNDNRVTDVIDSWSACMAESGYQVTDPINPQWELNLLENQQSSPEAINVAMADVNCKKDTDLVAVWSSVEDEYQNRLIEENIEILELSREQHEDRMRLAAKLLE
ncbi:hypothetical protein [Streptomyces sp. ST2-7A]|uniref:hypothetical protein n=1 Tax=Streptomyces sp. ST2-7A TaxID=2907214 RepID=UPI001F3BC7C9|nr:hypothetical protein [Streptomyces sp. ST2-7A]MCE7080352.1 hypothetical protein [Streptomyces sp. ST2-7A]